MTVGAIARALAAGLLVAMIPGTGLAASPQETAETAIRAGIEALEREDFNSAVNRFQEARGTAGARLPATFDFHRGRALMSAGRYAEAAMAFASYQARWPTKGKYSDDAAKLRDVALTRAQREPAAAESTEGVELLLGTWCMESGYNVGIYFRFGAGQWAARRESGGNMGIQAQVAIGDIERTGEIIRYREKAIRNLLTADTGLQQISPSEPGEVTLRVLGPDRIQVLSYVTARTNRKAPSPPGPVLQRCR